jgi:D-amino-acid dehydrogenase
MRIAVIGGGVLGASTAFHAALAGAEVVLADAAFDGRATAAGAGIISPWAAAIEDPHWHALAGGGARYYPELIARLGAGETGYRRAGALMVSTDRAALEAAAGRITARGARDAGALAMLSPAQARAIFPPLRPDLAALHVPGGGRVDGRLLAAALLAAAGRLGATLHEGTAGIVMRAGRAAGMRLADGVVEADCVVLCGGAWTAAELARHGITLRIAPQRGQIVHLGMAQDTRDWPAVLPLSDHYIVCFDNGRVVAGATRETGSGFDYRLTAGGLAKVLGDALSVAPGLAAATLLETRIGFRPMAEDGRPMLGPIAECPGLLVGNGLGASGLTIGPYAGRLLAQCALEGRAELDLAPYDPLRS